jgi:hypothetical protein
LLFALLCSASTNADTVPVNPTALERKQVQDGLAAAEDKRCSDAVQLLRTVADGVEFRLHPEATRMEVLGALVDCAFTLQDLNIALIYLEKLTEMPDENAAFRLNQLFWVAYFTKNSSLIVNTLRRIAHSGAEAVDTIPRDLLQRAYTDMARHYLDYDLRYRFLQILYDADYTPRVPFQSADWFMAEFARMSADRGDMDTVGRIIRGLTDPEILLLIRIDRRFDDIRRQGGLDSYLNLEAAAQRQIARFGQLVEKYPNALEGHVSLSEALEIARQYQDALDVIEPIALRLLEPGGREDFFDADEWENWALERYADALAQLGHRDRADAIHFKATQVPERSGDNVSQQINYAANQFSKGNYRGSLAALSAVSDAGTSDYGNILVHLYTVCAIAMGGIEREYLDSFSYLLEKETEFGGQVLRAYLCLDELDGADQNLIRRLEHPEERIKALKSLQEFEDERERLDQLWARYAPNRSTGALTPGELLDLRMDLVRQRDDVLEAVDAVGRIELVPLDSGRRH